MTPEAPGTAPPHALLVPALINWVLPVRLPCFFLVRGCATQPPESPETRSAVAAGYGHLSCSAVFLWGGPECDACCKLVPAQAQGLHMCEPPTSGVAGRAGLPGRPSQAWLGAQWDGRLLPRGHISAPGLQPSTWAYGHPQSKFTDSSRWLALRDCVRMV